MIPADTIARARDADLLATAQRLGARLKRVSTAELAGPCPVCGGRDRFSINTKKQLWGCRNCAKGGSDAISLVAHVRGLGFRDAVAFLTGEDTKPLTPRARAAPTAAIQAVEGHDAAFVSQVIVEIVREIVPVRRSPGERNLAEIRKINVGAIADVIERTDAIGWHPSVLFRKEGHPLDGKRLGAIIGIMTDAVTAKPTGAISRTYIHGGCKVAKAMTLGSPAGIVRLSADEDVLSGLHIAEGLETALDMMARGFRPMWSTGSTALLAKLPVLAGVDCLTVFADHDEKSGAGLKAANEVASRWRAAGCETHVYQPETPGDCNDAFREIEQ